jgi:hypothetical protein
VSVPVVHDYGPYTLYDLDALPEDGKRYELADGWLTELSPSPWHDHAADRLKDIFKDAARLAGAEVYVADGPNDIATPAGVRKPDVFVVPRDVARTAISGKVRTSYAGDLLLVAEVLSPRSGSEQVDRVRKVREYARAGIPFTGSWTSNPKPGSLSSPSAARNTPWTPRYGPGIRSRPASRSPSSSTRSP